MTTWGVFQQIRDGRHRLHRLRLVATDVPDDVKKPAVLEALEGAGCAARFSEAGIPWANHVVLAEPRWPETITAAKGEAVQTLTWDGLQGAQKGRVVSLELAAVDYAALALAAAQTGEQLYPWCRRVLLEAAAG